MPATLSSGTRTLVSGQYAVVELRETDDAAAGELWPAEIDPTELAAAERGYLLLEHLARRG
ncbi:hypothetical protein ACFT0G_27370 [Streptomyces sp. NPDC057020]|uniref:hypothetical protein n=1 Tax=unclassified Streptomyces TaxID=2593676 RepID=UPI00093E67B4|nr:hypothetical protein [Streptomyces sp. CB02009]OKJ63030.1 hypothetical protein AMK27_08385 [Streptomyces sp. CB02009]